MKRVKKLVIHIFFAILWFWRLFMNYRALLITLSLIGCALKENRTPQNSTLFLIKEFEGFFSNSYADIVGVQTIGYGHVIKPTENFDGKTLTQEEALDLLKDEISPLLNNQSLTCLKQNQLDALISLMFNLGKTKIFNSPLIQLLKQNKPDEAMDWFARWGMAGGNPIPGLLKRRLTELFVFADRELNPASTKLPSEQWGIPLRNTDIAWKFLKEHQKRQKKRGKPHSHIEDAILTYRKYKTQLR